MCAQRGSFDCTQITLASLPPSSVMLKTATGRTSMVTPGKVGDVEQHERVNRVAVEAEGVLEEPVVGRVDEAR